MKSLTKIDAGAASVALPLTMLLTLPLAMLGGGLVAAVYWLAVARELRGGAALARRAAMA